MYVGFGNTIIDLNNKLNDWRARYSVYPYNGYSIQEVLMQFYDSVKTCIDNVSEYNKLVEHFVNWVTNEGLQNAVIGQLDKWETDGTLQTIINEKIFKDLNTKIGDLKKEIDTNRSDISTVNNNVTVLANKVNSDKKELENLIQSVDDKILTYNLVAEKGSDISDKLIQLISMNNYPTTYYGIKIVLPIGRFKLSKTIRINTPNVMICGQGVFVTILESKAVDYAFDIQGQSGGKWLNGIQLSNFSIEGSSTQSDCLNMRQVGLNSHINNLNIQGFTGVGIRTHSCFDMNFSMIEIRRCGSYGILNLEQNNHNFPNQDYEETSYLKFTDVVVVDCNRNKVQWEIRGGNSYFINNCKVNEGSIGINMKNHTTRSFIDMLYMDGMSDNKSVVVNIENSDCREISINNLTTWNVDVGVKATGTSAITVGNCYDQYGTSKLFTPFEFSSDCTNCCFVGTMWKNYQYQNSPVLVPMKFGGRYKDNVLQNFVGAETYIEYREFDFTQGSNLHHFKITKNNFKIMHMTCQLHDFCGLVTVETGGKNIGLVSRTYIENDEWWIEIRFSDLSYHSYTTTKVNFSVTMIGYRTH